MAKDFKKKVDIQFGDALKAIESLTDALNNLNTSLQDTEDQADETGKKLDDIGGNGKKNTKGLADGFKSVGTSIGGVLKSLGLISIAYKVFDKFVETLQKNKKAADLISTSINFIDIALTKIIDSSIGPLTEGFERIFNDPQQAIKDFGELIRQNIQNRIEGLLELLPALGKAISLALEGEFSKAGQVALDATAKVALGVENATEKIGKAIEATTEFVSETLEAAEAQTQLDNQLATSAARQEALRLELQRQAEEQRQIRDDESKSIAERQAANDRLAEILIQQANAEKAIASESLKRAQADIANGNSSVEAEVALLEAKNRVAEIEERITGVLSEQRVNDIALRKEALDGINAQIDAETELANVKADEGQRLLNDIEGINQKLAAAEEANLTETESYRELFNQKRIIEEEYDLYQEERQAELDEKEAEAARKRQELRDKELQDIKDKAKEKKEQDIAVANASLQAAKSLLGAITNVVNARYEAEIQAAEGNEEKQEKLRKKQFEENKALQIVTAVIATAQSVMQAISSSPPPISYILAAANAAVGAIQIGLIASQKYNPKQKSGGTRPSVPPPPSTSGAGGQGGSTAPSIEFTGAASTLNEIGGGAQQSQPIVNANVSVSETEITGTQQTVSEYENASLLSG